MSEQCAIYTCFGIETESGCVWCVCFWLYLHCLCSEQMWREKEDISWFNPFEAARTYRVRTTPNFDFGRRAELRTNFGFRSRSPQKCFLFRVTNYLNFHESPAHTHTYVVDLIAPRLTWRLFDFARCWCRAA